MATPNLEPTEIARDAAASLEKSELRFRQPVRSARRDQRIGHQHRDRHRPDAAGDGRDRDGDLSRRREVDVAAEAVLGAVDANVDYHRPRLDRVGAELALIGAAVQLRLSPDRIAAAGSSETFGIAAGGNERQRLAAPLVFDRGRCSLGLDRLASRSL